MSTSTFTISYTHTVTYVTAKMLLLLKEIIREIGLDPSKLAHDWGSYEAAMSTWLTSRHLQKVTLEVYDPTNDRLITRWDLDIEYGPTGDGALWVDTAAIHYQILKAGLVPSSCQYQIKLVSPGGRAVPGWGTVPFRSTLGFNRYCIGATIGGNGISTQASYWGR
ncbi:MAG: HORMA domain containing protein [Steroidobacteraceae bacterium]|jgi:hypothetical protein